MQRRARTGHAGTAQGGDAASSSSNSAVGQLLDLIRILSAYENDRKQSLESRAASVIASCGGLVTLLLAFATWESGQHHLAAPTAAKACLAAGLSLLLLATIGSIVVGAPSNAGAIETTSLLAGLEDGAWNSPESHAQRAIATAQLLVLISKGAQNHRKARLLLASVSAQALGVAFIAFAVISILF